MGIAFTLVLILGACSQAPSPASRQQTSEPSAVRTATLAPVTPSPTTAPTAAPTATEPAAATAEPAAATEAPAATPGTAATQAPSTPRPPAATQAPVVTAAPAPTQAPVTPAPTAAPTAPPTAPPSTPAPAPTAQPTGGFVFPTFFVTILESRNGRLGVLTSGGATCSAVARLPDNVTILSLGTKIAPSSGMVNFDYAPTTQTGVGVHRVECSLSGQSQSAEARFTAP